jgi:hypothetical protein
MFHRAVISLDLALRHRVVSLAADVFDAVVSARRDLPLTGC